MPSFTYDMEIDAHKNEKSVENDSLNTLQEVFL